MSYSGMDFSHAQLDVFLGQFGPKSPLALWKALAESGRALRIVAYEVSAVPQVITDCARHSGCHCKRSLDLGRSIAKLSHPGASMLGKTKMTRVAVHCVLCENKAEHFLFLNRILPYIRHIASPTTFLQRHREKVLQLWSPDRRRSFHPAVEITCFGKAALWIATGGGIWRYGLLCRYCIHLYMIYNYNIYIYIKYVISYSVWCSLFT
jgi:hypothetical protein